MTSSIQLNTLKADVEHKAEALFFDVLCNHHEYVTRLAGYIHATKVYSQALCHASQFSNMEVSEAYLEEAKHYDISPSYLADVLRGIRRRNGLT